ncbi:hypothetical protein GGR45_000844 [Sphingomonas zeae]|jgi:uncharacterized protein|uniref:DUF192 domain-containing protein n=2 Tax=Sphingomonadaceae TaxID=41297 RepID=A0A7Y6B6T0_9SPHN|nr:DUF192 domain-containing protein [Sphingomonas zeae]MBB4047333.1 hypothetical protein [Sphingomonas zeae]NUU48477.1 DUF192 domain-containing protein [Sphingomonas zeae]
MMRVAVMALALAGAGLAGCSGENSSSEQAGQKVATVPVTITTAQGRHRFNVEAARTSAEQAQGLMYRTDLKPDGGMLFAPYPPEGGGPRAASFWMKNTPTPLDILFIRADGTIARIAENTVPFSEAQIPSGEPVAAVLELVGGRSAELGIAEGDSVSWRR